MILMRYAPVSYTHLADLMDAGIPAGPGVGATLQTLLTAVMEGRLPNEREALLEAATV